MKKVEYFFAAPFLGTGSVASDLTVKSLAWEKREAATPTIIKTPFCHQSLPWEGHILAMGKYILQSIFFPLMFAMKKKQQLKTMWA